MKLIVRAAAQLCRGFLVLAAVSQMSCSEAEFCEEGASAQSFISVALDPMSEALSPGTRSQIGDAAAMQSFENKLKDMTVFQFDEDGRLYHSYYFPSLDGKLQIQGRSERKYRLLGLINMYDRTRSVTPGCSEKELESIIYNMTYINGLASTTGCPMVCHPEDGEYCTLGGPVTMRFTRMLSKYNFTIDRSALHHGTFETDRVTLKQTCVTAHPFMRHSRAESASDVILGDKSTDADVKCVNGGGTVQFYCLENAQGVLLPDNHDPWQKIPESISDRKDLCTYLEVLGTYKDNSGYTAVHTYRMYLGSDNVSDFNVLRGTEYNLKLVVTDDGAYRASWKAERQAGYDPRSAYFYPKFYTVRYKENVSVSVSGSVQQLECAYALSDNLKAAGVSFDASTMTLSLDRKLASDVTGTLSLSSWDGAIRDTCNVTAKQYGYKVTMRHTYSWTTEANQEETTDNVLEETVTFDVEDHLGKETLCRFLIEGIDINFKDFQTAYEWKTGGVVRVPGNVESPPFQLTPEFLKQYPVKIIFNSEIISPSWDDITIIFP